MSNTGVVLASYGRGVLVQAAGGTLHCGLIGRKLRIVCGDQVTWTTQVTADTPSVQSVAPRRNLIERIDARGRAEPVVANIDRLAIVVAAEPSPDWYLVDRYWAGAILKDIEVLLIVSKVDLGTQNQQLELANYQRLKLPILEVSSPHAMGIDELRLALTNSVTLLVGQSGVGKSSLVNARIPEAIIDAPGVRDFAPPARIVRAAERGFIEIHALSVKCRFNDCLHLEEPGCAVRFAVAQNTISPRRYESYRRLNRLFQEMAT